MKHLLLTSMILVLSSCSGSGGTSGPGGITTSPVIIDPAQSQYAQIADGFYSKSIESCVSDLHSSNYTRVEMGKASNELIASQYLYSDSLCNNLLQITSLVYGFHSYTIVGNSDLTTVALLEAQIAVLNVDVLNTYNQISLFESNSWILNNAKSVIDKIPQPGQAIPYVSNTHRDLTLRVINNSQTIFINGVEYIKQ